MSKQTDTPLKPFEPSNRQKVHLTELGQALWALVNTPDVIVRLQTASDLRVPAVRALERPLFQSGLLKPRASVTDEERGEFDQYKRLLGGMVRAVLEANGYRLRSSSPYAISGGLYFSSGSIYEAIEQQVKVNGGS